MNPDVDHHDYELPDEAVRLIDYLFIEDGRTGGRPSMREEDDEYAREWLVEVLLDTLARLAHTGELKRRYGGVFRAPRVRLEWPESGRPAEPAPDRLFRHHDLLAPEEAEAVAERGVGPDVLVADALARLLLNPYALWDLADLIDATLPAWWDDPMRQRGERLLEEAELESFVPPGRKEEQPAKKGGTSRSWFLGRSQPPAVPEKPTPLATVPIEMIGREHSGKTALKICYYKGPLAGPQPSGLELAAADPRVMTQWMIDALETYRDLTGRGLVSTLDPEVIPYQLYFADEPRAVLQLREVVGQILTHTTPDCDEQQQGQYRACVENLTRADVLQVVIGCPASHEPADLERFEADLVVTADYLREALKVRATTSPVAVQLLLAKVDIPFGSPQEAQAALPNDRLTGMLGRLVRVVEGSAKVGMGAIFPVSAFGFNTAGRPSGPATTAGAGPEGRPVGGFSLVNQGEPEYLLKPGVKPAPFNLTAAVWWAVMAGLLLKPADDRGQQLADTARMMAGDLEAMKAWFVPLKAGSAK
jgi:hypothetical protein